MEATARIYGRNAFKMSAGARWAPSAANDQEALRLHCRSAGRMHMKPFLLSWQFWAVLSAIFAALTAIFAKVGIQNINSDFATFIRTIVIIAVLGGILTLTKEWQPLGSITTKTWVFLTLSGLATGASWLCYFRALQLGDASQVAPIDKLSVVLVALFGALFLGESLLPIGWMGVVLIALGSFLVASK